MKLLQDCIDAIEKEAVSYYPTIDSTNQLVNMHTLGYCRGAKAALSTSSIYSKACLIPLEEAFDFAQWVATNHFKWDANYLKFVDDRKYHNKYYTRVELYDLFQLSKPIV